MTDKSETEQLDAELAALGVELAAIEWRKKVVLDSMAILFRYPANVGTWETIIHPPPTLRIARRPREV
jgi:hypothetical protein